MGHLSNTSQIEKLLETTCALSSLLTLLPPTSDPFSMSPRDHLPQLLILLSHLRSGDSRFLPLLLSKVSDILPQLASPMLKTIPEPAPAKMEPMSTNGELDMFNCFDHGANNMSKGPLQVVSPFDHNMGVNETLPYGVTKRVEELGSGGSSSGESPIEHSPFTSPPVMTSSMDFPGLSEYTGFPDLSQSMSTQQSRSSSMGNQQMNNQQMNGQNMNAQNMNNQQMNGQNMAGQAMGNGIAGGGNGAGSNIPRTPMRQNSGYNGTLPRAMPEFHHYVKDESIAMGGDNGMDLPFR
jgi:hypothetical protein